MPQKSYNVLFVCLGNICRSPAAENIFRHQASLAGFDELIHIDSAGTHDYHPGKSPDSRMCNTLQNRDIPSTGAARQFSEKDYINFDIILTMDDDNYARITALATSAALRKRVRKFTDFCRKPDHQISEVPDPYYGDEDGFELVADILEDGCRQLLEHARKQIT